MSNENLLLLAIAIPALTGAVEAARRWLSGPPEPAY